MERFLNEEAIQRSKNRARRALRIFFALAVCALILFAFLCLMTRTGNARRMLYLAMACMIPAGWCLIALWLFAVKPARAEEQHLTGLAAAEKDIREGRFFLDTDSFRIPKSVRVRKVRLETGTEMLSLNLNDQLACRMPPDGSLVRVETSRKFITGMEVLESGSGQAERPKTSRSGHVIRTLGDFILPAILWAVTAMIFTGFVFNRITDTAPENKIVLFADCEIQNAPDLAEKLEKELDGAVRMVKIHPFTYAMFDSSRLKQADLYLVPESHREEYREWFLQEDRLTAFDPASGVVAADAYFLYNPSETYCLYTGKSSVHLEDGLARQAAELILSLTDSAKEEAP